MPECPHCHDATRQRPITDEERQVSCPENGSQTHLRKAGHVKIESGSLTVSAPNAPCQHPKRNP
jgi:hypothetical protein